MRHNRRLRKFRMNVRVGMRSNSLGDNDEPQTMVIDEEDEEDTKN